jgi:hypothetical protein
MGRGESLPLPVVTARNIRHLENKGLIFPRSVHTQAARGLPVMGNKNVPAWVYDPMFRKEGLRILNTWKPPQNRYSAKPTLPATVQKKLKALENRAKTAAIEGTARALATPWKVAAGARRLASMPGRAYKSLKATVAAARRSVARPPKN